MKALQILMPMGGLGQRYLDAGYSVPKPLIEVDGEPMFLKALASFDKYLGEKKLIFVVRQDAEDKYRLASKIKDIQPKAKIALLTENTQGAVETCLLAQKFVEPDLPTVIMDCDFSFTSSEYFAKLSLIAEENAYDGMLLSFESDRDRYSYALTNELGEVIRTAEKQVISNNALAGAYCFRSGRLFLDAARALLKKPIGPEMKEYYISLLYNILIDEKRRIALSKVDQFYSYGTPEELESYLNTQ